MAKCKNLRTGVGLEGNGMTDKEIIKALECCSNAEPCENCPYQKQCDETDLAEIALDLINRQQAEIKELNTIRSRLIYDSGTLTKISDELYQKIKAEAVKEFAEKLKFVWFDNRYDSPDIDFDYFVDILVETLVGDTE